MILKDYIKKHRNEMVKIGMGSGFIWMGRLKDFDDRTIDSLNENLLNDSDKRLESRKKEAEKIRDQLKAYFKDGETNDSVLRNLCDSYVVYSDGIVEEKVYKANYIPIQDRQIRDKYNNVQTNERYIFHILILDGFERGGYWLWDEWIAKETIEREDNANEQTI